jgi:hypothetical protein
MGHSFGVVSECEFGQGITVWIHMVIILLGRNCVDVTLQWNKPKVSIG